MYTIEPSFSAVDPISRPIEYILAVHDSGLAKMVAV